MKKGLTLLLLLWSCIALLPPARAANYYWVGNGGNWNDVSHWASFSNGPGNAYMTPPTKDDNVFFDANSFSTTGQVVLLGIGDNNCYDMSWTGVDYNPKLKFPTAVSRLNVYHSIELNNNMTVDFLGAEDVGVIRMLDTRLTSTGDAAAVATRGIQIPNISFEGVNGIWALPDNLNVAGQIKITNGTFRSGAPSSTTFTVTADEFIVDGATVALSIDRMNITATSLFQIKNIASLVHSSGNGANAKLSNISTAVFQITAANVSTFGTLHLTGQNAVLSASGKNLQFDGVVYLEASVINTILGSHSYKENIVITNGGVTVLLEAGATQTFSNKTQIIANNTDCGNFVTLRSTQAGSAAIIDHGAGPFTDVDFFYLQDIHVNSNNNFVAGQSVNLGNVTGWTITQASGIKLYWIGGSGSWSEGSHWSISSGGAPLLCIPTAADTVIFDGNSFPGSTESVTVDLPAIYFNTMIWTDPDNDQPTWLIPSGSINIGGSLTLAPSQNVTIGNTASTFFNFTSALPGNTITAADNNPDGFDLGNITFAGTGSWTLGAELNASGTIEFNGGTFNSGAGNYSISATKILIDGTGVNISLNDSEVFIETFQLVSVGTFNADQSNLYVRLLFAVTPVNLTFNELFMLGANTELRGTNLIFKDVQLNSTNTASVFGSHTYNNLLQFNEPGMTAEFEAGSVQKVKNMNSLGTLCGGEILIRSTSSGNQFTFEALPGASDIILQNVLLQDSNADPAGQAMTFSAIYSQNLGNVTGWDYTAGYLATPRKFYWIGGNGNWNNPAKWSFDSGGSPANCLPTPIDDVEFDANSFTAGGQTITLNGPEQYCRNMIWTDEVKFVPTMRLPAGNALSIYGSLRLAPTGVMSLNFGAGDAANLNFKATTTGNTIVLSGQMVPNVTFEGAGGGWNFGTIVTLSTITKSITLINGELDITGLTLSVPQFLVSGAGAVLTMGNAILEIDDLFEITAIGTLNAGTSSLRTNLLRSTVSGLSFYEVRLVNNGDDVFADIDTEIDANGLIFEQLLLLGGTGENVVHGSHTFNGTLQFDITTNVAFFTFDAASTQTLGTNGSLLSTGQAGKPAIIQTSISGQTANFFKLAGSVCLEFANIYDIVTGGGAIFGTVNSSVLGLSLGWILSELANCGLFLPVECVDFTAAINTDQSVGLVWTTAQEVNNSGFEVQRSTDGRRFETIAWVPGAGTTTEAQKYNYTDQRAAGLGDLYYRLLQIDFDGTNAYACDILSVSLRSATNAPMVLYPNPAGELIQVRWFGNKTGTVLIRLFDQSGRLVLDREWNGLEGSNQQELPLAELARGIYELQLVNTNGRTESARIVKQ